MGLALAMGLQLQCRVARLNHVEFGLCSINGLESARAAGFFNRPDGFFSRGGVFEGVWQIEVFEVIITPVHDRQPAGGRAVLELRAL